jgi:hypothetical protein
MCRTPFYHILEQTTVGKTSFPVSPAAAALYGSFETFYSETGKIVDARRAAKQVLSFCFITKDQGQYIAGNRIRLKIFK